MKIHSKILFLTFFLLISSCSIIEEYTGASEDKDSIEKIDSTEEVYNELEDDEEEMRMEKEARSIKESINIISDSSYKYFDRYTDVGTLRVFALPEVSDEYLIKVGAIYKLIFDEDNPDIDRNLKNEFFQTMKNNYVYQRVGFKGPELYDLDSNNPK